MSYNSQKQEHIQEINVYLPKNPKGNYDISKIRIKDDWEEIFIIYESYGKGTEVKKTEFSCKEKPSDSFPYMVGRLINNVCSICGLDNSVWISPWISEIKFKYLDDGMLVAITIKCEIGERIISVPTPFVFPRDELLDKINAIVAEAEEYIAGKRAQLSLFDNAEVA